MLSQLADFGELIGGIAVVASLIYLGVQIRQNTKTVRASTLHQNTQLWSSLFLHMSDPALARAYGVGVTADPDVKPSQYTQFFFLCRSMFVAFENQYYQRQQGLLDAATYESYERSISTQLLAFRGFRIWWELNRAVFTPDFADHVDEMIARVPEATPDSLMRDWHRLAAAETAKD